MAKEYQHAEHDVGQSDAASIERLGELIKDIRTCMLTTLDKEDRLTSRPMTTLPEDFGGDLWLFVSRGSDAVEQVERDSRVNLSYAGSSGWVSVAGDADVLRDTERNAQLWNPFVEAYFPNGPQDPDVALLRVHVHSAQYWEAPGKVGQVLAMVKARVTDARPDIGESQTVEL